MAKESKEKNEKKIVKEKDIKKKDKDKKKNKKTKKEGNSTSFKKEMKVIKWPTFKEIVKYTIATIVFCIVLVIFFVLLSFIMAEVTGGVFN